jgi:hypothetical protein
MTKEQVCALTITLILAVCLILSISSAADSYQDLVAQQAGVSAEQIDQLNNLPKTPEEISKIQQEYMQNELNNLVAKNKYLGGIHTFLMNHQIIPNLILNRDYTFNFRFLVIIGLWLIVAVQFYMIQRGLFDMPEILNLVFGIVIAILLAHLGLFNLLTDSMFDFVLSKTLTSKIIFWVLIVIVVLVEFFAAKVLTKNLANAKLARERAGEKQSAKVIKTLADNAT